VGRPVTPEEVAAEHGCARPAEVRKCQCGRATAWQCPKCREVLMVESAEPCVHGDQFVRALTRSAKAAPFVAWTGGLFSHGSAR